MPLDVRPEHRTIIQNILKKFVPGYRVVVFGSRITSNAQKTSDLDLCIIGDQRITFETLAGLRYAFSESNLPYKVDVIDWCTLAPDFKEIIMTNCLEIQSAPKASGTTGTSQS